MKTFRTLVLLLLLMTGGCRLLGEFVFAAIEGAVEMGIDAAVHGIERDPPPPPPPPPPHRSPRVLDRTRLR
jgi:hypothetical protein